MTKPLSMLLGIILFSLPGVALSATVISQYEAYAFNYDNGTGANDNHAMTLGSGADPLKAAGFYTSDDYYFAAPGTFTEFDNGTATLVGILTNQSDSAFRWQVSLTMANRTATPAGGLLKTGGGSDTSDWHFYVPEDPWSGTLMGLGSLTGSILNVIANPANPNFQVGTGANDKDGDLGASGWMAYSGTILVDGGGSGKEFNPNDLKGDFNMDLVVVPIPAAAWLFVSGFSLMGFAGIRRGRG